MAQYGAYLTTTDGRAFITDDSYPLALVNKGSASGTGSLTVTFTKNSNETLMPFAYTTTDASISMGINNNVVSISSHPLTGNNANYQLVVYFFGSRIQTPPAWGMAVWNDKGECILTNETRVLTDVTQILNQGDANAGVNMNQTRTGKIAIQPCYAGLYAGVVQGRPIQIPAAMAANYNGTSTRMFAMMAAAPPSGGQISLAFDSKSPIVSINAANYD